MLAQSVFFTLFFPFSSCTIRVSVYITLHNNGNFCYVFSSLYSLWCSFHLGVIAAHAHLHSRYISSKMKMISTMVAPRKRKWRLFNMLVMLMLMLQLLLVDTQISLFIVVHGVCCVHKCKEQNALNEIRSDGKMPKQNKHNAIFPHRTNETK